MRDKKFDLSLLTELLIPFQEILARDDITELVINQPGIVAVETRKGWEWIEDDRFDMARLQRVAKLVANSTSQTLDATKPLLSAVLPTGERVQVVAPPAVDEGSFSMTIRKPSSTKLSLDDLDNYGLFKKTAKGGEVVDPVKDELAGLFNAGEWAKFLRAAVIGKQNILISGSTGSGKTTLSKALIAEIPLDERLLTIEDTRELEAPHKNVVHMIYSKGGQGKAPISAKELLEASLRMRPDRILLQELRDGTAFYYLRNVNSGHPGSITTVHADSAELAFEQLTLLVKESDGGSDLARDDIRAMLTSLVDVVVQAKKVEGEFSVTEIWWGGATKKAELRYAA
ncbi:P-type DNA transfer ATPase VirB11 [Alterisphingorhabdus coralli]|uniref:P-type DNA transfer ATPase VirB11 n=1 Tax=Alterisphingorhabdus coralli TaxID=3071408 RepID=A0AA97F992_9SPHN|nr:P-type DNA transfer ATPase VirB11 [Parasphingorhabdus sp. SCSIO 66989]WOE76749.1 P-type DNA transfer ATPase VirB11 [Parasphingorhabdus sp. SCSIO 66989]